VSGSRPELPDPELRVARLGKVLREQAGEIVDLEQQVAALMDDLTAARDLAASYVGVAIAAEAERDALAARVEEARAAVDELAAMRATKLVRWTAGPRRVYGRVRRLGRTR
jgi:hypothetical protein